MRQLLIRPGAIGDFVLSLPALEALCRGDDEIWAARQNVSLVRFARARAIQDTGLDLFGIPEVDPPQPLLENLRQFDRILSWYGTNRPEFQEAARKAGFPIVFLSALPPAQPGLHAADFYMEQAVACGAPRRPAIPRLPCPRREEDFIAIHPFSGSPAKNWPLERFQLLARSLQAQLPVRWILEPGPEVPGCHPALPPTFDLYELACHLAPARLYIGNDSGITHLAAAAGVPVLALFGPTDPAVWAPRGANRIVILRSDSPDRNMKALSVGAVQAAAEHMLNEAARL